MSNECKTIKDVAKEAKMRLKSGFWQTHNAKIEEQIDKTGDDGIAVSKVIRYYSEQAQMIMNGINSEEEDFYQKVKLLLDTEGEVPDAIGRLTDNEFFSNLSYDRKQRYLLELSEKYQKALKRYYKELEFNS